MYIKQTRVPQHLWGQISRLEGKAPSTLGEQELCLWAAVHTMQPCLTLTSLSPSFSCFALWHFPCLLPMSLPLATLSLKFASSSSSLQSMAASDILLTCWVVHSTWVIHPISWDLSDHRSKYQQGSPLGALSLKGPSRRVSDTEYQGDCRWGDKTDIQHFSYFQNNTMNSQTTLVIIFKPKSMWWWDLVL